MKGHSLPGPNQRKSPAKTDPTKDMSTEMKAEYKQGIIRKRKAYEGSAQELQDNLNMNLKKMSGEKTDFQKELEKRGLVEDFEADGTTLKKKKKSPSKKELIGGQKNLPDGLKAKIEAAPGKMYDSPAKQEGPIPKKNLKLQKGEMEGTWIYPGGDKNERIFDYEDRVEFARSDAESSEGKEKKQHLANAKKLQHEADIIRNRKSPGKMYGKKQK